MSKNISNVILDSVKLKNKTCLRKKTKINKIKKKRKKEKEDEVRVRSSCQMKRLTVSATALIKNRRIICKGERKRVVLAGQMEMKQTI